MSGGEPVFPSAAAFRARDWTRKTQPIYAHHGTALTFELEARWAAIEGADHALLCPSGLSAITLVHMALLRPGDEVLVPLNVYPAHRRFALAELAGWGVQVRPFNPLQPDALPITPATRLVWLEAPCSLTFEFPDVPAVAARCRAHGVPLALDSTWAAGTAYRPFELGADLTVHSLSKYAAAGTGAVLGAVACRDKAWYDTLKLCAMRLGLGGAHAVAGLVLPGLASLAERYTRQDAATRQIVAGLAPHLPPGCRLLHPMLPSTPGHAVWQRDGRGAAALFSLVLREHDDEAAVDRFVDALASFSIGFGWGGPTSRVAPQGREVASVEPLSGELVRFAVGQEPPEVLLADLRQALDTLR